MAKRPITQCPLCDASLITTELQCGDCGTTLRGDFPPSRCAFCSLPEDQFTFLVLFLRCRGNLRDVERTLGLSYPTIRARLDVLLSTLGYTGEAAEGAAESATDSASEDRRRQILDELNTGKVSADEAVHLLEALG